MARPGLLAILGLAFSLLLGAACAPARAEVPHLTVAAVWTGGEREAFMTIVDAFTAKTKIQVSYESMRNDMGAILRTRVVAGTPPDVVLNPRPGEVAEFARAGSLVDLGRFLAPETLAQSYSSVYTDLGKVDGKQVGIVFKANSKSTFWYRPGSFAQFGLRRPENLDELFSLAETYHATGQAPFAIGGQDAWVLTDYQENLLARLVDPATYNGIYLSHSVAWTDPKVKQSLALFARFFQPGYEPGGARGALNTGFVPSIGQVFGSSPEAAMIYEGGFVGLIAESDVNKNLQPGRDIDFFPFPQVDPAYGNPVVGGGDIAVMFKDTPEARAFVEFLISKEAADLFAAANCISPNKQIDPTRFSNPLTRKEYQQLATATTFLFDGSDMAPSSFGGDYEFTELRKLVENPAGVDKIAEELERLAASAY